MPLDALTTQRIRALEIVVAWLIGSRLEEYFVDDQFAEVSMEPTYILELAEKIQEAQEEEE